MKFWARLSLCASAVLLFLSLGGCMPSDQGQLEEEREAHFIAGKSCVNSRDFEGAIDEFERALEVNPHSASAHFQLGTLYEEKDPAAAIYHYEQYLKLRPKSENAELIGQRIMNCKQDLAKAVFPLPISMGMQRQVDQLVDENRKLKEENEHLKTYLASQRQSQSNSVVQPRTMLAQPQSQTARSIPQTTRVLTSTPDKVTHSTAGAGHSHAIQSGETAYSIARKYGVKLEAFMALNPGLDAHRLRVGQVVRIP